MFAIVFRLVYNEFRAPLLFLLLFYNVFVDAFVNPIQNANSVVHRRTQWYTVVHSGTQ